MSYANLNGKSGITNCAITDQYIDVKFASGDAYRYTKDSVGSENLAIMKSLAMNGKGLNGFINKNVRCLYAERLDEFLLIPKCEVDPEPEPTSLKSVPYRIEVDRDKTPLCPTQIERLDTAELISEIIGGDASFDGMLDLKMLAGRTPQHLARRFGISLEDANRLALCFEFGKRLANSHTDRAKITAPSDVADFLMPKLRYLQHEVTVCLALDTKGNVTDSLMMTGENDKTELGEIISHRAIFEGTLNACVFHPREIFRFAIDCGANSIVIAHNHPSGDPQPSQEDIRATKQLVEAGNHIGIKVLDHIVIGDGIFVSLKEEGFI